MVAFFYLLVSIVATRYMYKKSKKFKAIFLSHKNDNPLLAFMFFVTLLLTVVTVYTMPESPPGPPAPKGHKIEDQTALYDIPEDRRIYTGFLTDENKITFDNVDLFQMSTDECPGCEDLLWIEAMFEAKPLGGRFEYTGEKLDQFKFDEKTNILKIEGDPKDLEAILYYMSYHPACILDKTNQIDVSMRIAMKDDRQKTLEEKKYQLPLNVDSGTKKNFSGRIQEPILAGKTEATPPFFQNILQPGDIKGKVWLPFSPACSPLAFSVDANSLFSF